MTDNTSEYAVVVDVIGLSNGKYAAHITVGWFSDNEKEADAMVTKIKAIPKATITLAERVKKSNFVTLQGFKPHIEHTSRAYNWTPVKNGASVLHVECDDGHIGKEYQLKCSSARKMIKKCTP